MLIDKSEIDWTDKSSDMIMNVGKICEYELCKTLDFLPFECKLCKKSFCIEHRLPISHECTKYIDINFTFKDAPIKITNKPKYIQCKINNCKNVVENNTISLILAKCNKCNKIRCGTCRTKKICCK